MMGALQDTDHVNRFQNLLHYEVIEKAPEYCSVGQPYAVWVMTDKLAHAAHVESPYVYCSHILVQRYFRCNSPGSLAKLTAIRRASSLVSRLAASRRPASSSK
jgi:hypothetical protein